MLKRITTTALILSSITLLCFAAVAPARFDGTWKLNRSKSEGLTGGLANADILLVVTQDEKKLTAEQQVIVRGRVQPSQILTYNLDGKESEVEVVRPLAGTMHLQAKQIDNGKILELRSTISGDNQGKEVTIVTKEYWELAEGGKALKITRTRETPEKSQDFKLYFDKQ